jgi:hypothetical protein
MSLGKEEAVVLARMIAEYPYLHSLTEQRLAAFILREVADTLSPDSGEGAGSVRPAARVKHPTPAPTSNATGRAACNLPELFSSSERTTDVDKPLAPIEDSAATVPTIYPTSGMEWQDEQIALWLESHAMGYEHAGSGEVAYALREKADGVRRREYMEK